MDSFNVALAVLSTLGALNLTVFALVLASQQRLSKLLSMHITDYTDHKARTETRIEAAHEQISRMVSRDFIEGKLNAVDVSLVTLHRENAAMAAKVDEIRDGMRTFKQTL